MSAPYVRGLHWAFCTQSSLTLWWETSSRGALDPKAAQEKSVAQLQVALERRFAQRRASQPGEGGGALRGTGLDAGNYAWQLQYSPVWLGRWLEGGTRLRVPVAVLSGLEPGQRYRVRVRARRRGGGAAASLAL